MEKKNENGIISIFVLFSMLFLLFFIFTSYFFIKNKIALKENQNLQLKKMYSEDIDVIENESNLSNEVIPIYNIDELNIIGTGSFLKIKNKIYECGIGKNYMLRDNIIVDIDEDIINARVGFNDYKLYSSNYHIDNFSYDIYYYKDNTYWKNIFYKKYVDDEKNTQNNYTENNFSIIDKCNNMDDYTYLMLWTDNNNEFKNLEIVSQKEKPQNVNQIQVYNKNYDKLNKKDGEFYIFINIGNKI